MGSEITTLNQTMKLIILVLLASAQSFKSSHQNRGTRSFHPSSYKETHYLSYLGSFNATKPEMHPLEGKIYYRLDDENVLTVINFVYPNPGPDAFSGQEKMGTVMEIPLT